MAPPLTEALLFSFRTEKTVGAFSQASRNISFLRAFDARRACSTARYIEIKICNALRENDKATLESKEYKFLAHISTVTFVRALYLITSA